MRTYEEYLIENGKVVTDTYVCPECGRSDCRAFEIVEQSKDHWVCSKCYLAQLPPAEPAPVAPWETELAYHVRAIRTQLQDKWRWAVMPDSPLTDAAKDKVMTYLKTLNRLTIDYTTPADVVWPDEPTLTGTDYDPDA